MRTLVIVIVTIFIIIGGWLFFYQSIDQNSTQAVNSLDKISKNIQKHDWALVYIEFLKVKENWDKKREILTTLIDHHEIDNIDLSMARAEQYLKSKNISLSLGEIEVLKKLFNIVKENEAINLSNIL